MKQTRFFSFFFGAVLFICLVFGADVVPLAYSTPVPKAPPLYFKFLDMRRETDGRVSRDMALECSVPLAFNTAVVFRDGSDKTLYRATLHHGRFTISAHKPSRIRLFAWTRAKDRVYTASANLVLYANSRALARRVPARPELAGRMTDLPWVEPILPPAYYWPQTGQSLLFRLISPFNPDTGNLSGGLTVLENGHLEPLSPNEHNAFAYTPPHDINLRKKGHTATRDDILFTRFTQNGVTYWPSYTLMLHRGRFAFDRPAAGRAVFGASLIFFCGWAIRKRRHPWWRA